MNNNDSITTETLTNVGIWFRGVRADASCEEALTEEEQQDLNNERMELSVYLMEFISKVGLPKNQALTVEEIDFILRDAKV